MALFTVFQYYILDYGDIEDDMSQRVSRYRALPRRNSKLRNGIAYGSTFE